MAWLLIPVLGVVLAAWIGGGNLGGASGWVADGAAADTFWNSSIVDIPGGALFAVHCHGRMAYEVQLGETSPAHNPCLRPTTHGSSLSIERLGDLPGVSSLYRYSVNGGSWTYYVVDRGWSWPPGIPHPAGWPEPPSP